VTRGIVAAAGGIFRLPRVIPRGRATELMLTGDRIDAAEAHRLGLVTRVVPTADVLSEAITLAERISANAPLAIRETLRVLRVSVDAGDDECWSAIDAASARVQSSADAVEGALAFTEKRVARWTGR
jgi:enoyl-CoA hydratase